MLANLLLGSSGKQQKIIEFLAGVDCAGAESVHSTERIPDQNAPSSKIPALSHKTREGQGTPLKYDGFERMGQPPSDLCVHNFCLR